MSEPQEKFCMESGRIEIVNDLPEVEADDLLAQHHHKMHRFEDLEDEPAFEKFSDLRKHRK